MHDRFARLASQYQTLQVGNARRIIFTAAALLVFAIVTWRSYWLACYEGYSHCEGILFSTFYLPGSRWPELLLAAPTALAPAVFLIAAGGNSLRSAGEPVMLASAALFFLTILTARLLGHEDAVATMERIYQSMPPPEPGFPIDDGDPDFKTKLGKAFGEMMTLRQRWIDNLPGYQAISWLYLLPPIILTTAFVVITAWRRATRARDVEVDAAGEGE